MRRENIRTAEDALLYMIECTLATVEKYALNKRRPAGEYARQIAIAQAGVDNLVYLRIPTAGTRAEDVIDKHSCRVIVWASYLRQGVSGGTEAA